MAGSGVAKAILEVTDHWAGDNYVITVHAIYEPTPLNDHSGTLIAWKRVYIEKDKMYKIGSHLAAEFTADGNSDPDVITVTDASVFSVDDSVYVFDADHQPGEPATIDGIDGNDITLDVDLADDYDAGYDPGKEQWANIREATTRPAWDV